MNLITDRKSIDISFFKQLNEALNGGDYYLTGDWENLAERATYGKETVRRVCAAINEVSDYLQAIGITVDIKPINLDAEYMSVEDTTNFLFNVSSIQSAFKATSSLPMPNSMDSLTFEQANNIEKILDAAYKYAQEITKTFLYSGNAVCGENFYRAVM